MRLYVMRHASTPMNKERRINGPIDEPLSEEGIQQLPQIVVRLKDTNIEHIIASPLQRAVATATPIAHDHQCELITDARLVEVNPGAFAGQSYESTIPLFGMNSSEVLSTYSYDFTPYGGETSEQVRERVQSFLDDVAARQLNNVLVVTHGGTIRWINYLCTGKKTAGHLNGDVLTFDI